jgi:hypothetical protein
MNVPQAENFDLMDGKILIVEDDRKISALIGVYLDSRRTTRDDSPFSSAQVSDSNKRVIARRVVRAVGAAMQLFETECTVPGEEPSGGTINNRPCNVPANAKMIPSGNDFSDT